MKEEEIDNAIQAYRHNAQELMIQCSNGLISNRTYEEVKEELEKQYLDIRLKVTEIKAALLDQVHKEINDELYPPQGRHSLPPR